MELQTTKSGSILIVKPVENRIDAVSAGDFKLQMLQFFENGETKIVLDLSGLDFLDSSGLGAIISMRKSAGDKGQVVVCGIHDSVKRLFELTKMDRVFRVYSNSVEAEKALLR